MNAHRLLLPLLLALPCVAASAQTFPVAAAILTISSPSSTVMVIGFSQSTLNPASRKDLVISKWVLFGVATVTRSSLSSRLRSPASISVQSP